MKVTKPWLKKLLIIGSVLLLTGIAVIWYLFTLTFDDTKGIKPDYSVNATDLIREFEVNGSLANRKYAEKIIRVSGVVTEVEKADTSVNIKMADSSSGSYIIFAFQSKDVDQARNLKEGETTIIKGSCSGGTYSAILETEFITFKRCVVDK